MAQSDHNLLYEDLRDSIKTTMGLIQSLMSEIKSNEVNTATLEAKLDAIDEATQTLTRIVRDGNGTKSVIVRLALLEEDVKDLFDRDEEFRKFVYKRFEEEQQTKKRDTKGKAKYDQHKILTILKIVPGAISLVLVLLDMFLRH